MESFEFLGGRYNRPEQIMSGPVQAFRAQSAANGKTVFIHRISTTEAPEEQASLLKLLTTALVKSSETKRLVLDFGEENGHWYVVTESEPQCALLREWLQLEIAAAAGNARPAVKSAPPPGTKSPSVSKQEETDPGEFTRFLKARTPANPPGSTPRFVPEAPVPPAPQDLRTKAMFPNQDLPKQALPKQDPPKPELPLNDPKPGEFTQLFASSGPKTPPLDRPLESPPSQVSSPATPSSIPAPPAQAPVARSTPGEFTNFFNASESERKQPKPGPILPQPQRPSNALSRGNAPSESGASKPEPGEFTSFFQPGLPPVPQKPSSDPQTTSFERTHSSPLVQRPNTPVKLPPPDPKPAESGEFTQLFSRPDTPKAPAHPAGGSYQPPPPARSDPLGFTKQPAGQPTDLSDDLFNDKIDIPKPLPSSQPKQSEFTRMFGTAGAAPPPLQKQSVVAPPRENPMLDGTSAKDPLLETQPFAAANRQGSSSGASDAPANSPSEFTRIMQGGYGPAKSVSDAGTPPAPGAAPVAGGSGSPLLNVNVSPMNPAAALPHLGSAGGSLGSANAHGSASGASVGTPVGAANVYGPRIPGAQMKVPSANFAVPAPSAKGANKKMIIFFSIIGVLAVLLIVLMLFVLKNK